MRARSPPRGSPLSGRVDGVGCGAGQRPASRSAGAIAGDGAARGGAAAAGGTPIAGAEGPRGACRRSSCGAMPSPRPRGTGASIERGAADGGAGSRCRGGKGVAGGCSDGGCARGERRR